MIITTELFDEIEDGLEGVTKGPWGIPDPPPNNNWDQYTIGSLSRGTRIADACPLFFEAEKNARHIARLDPDTVRELVRLARIGLEVEERRATLEAKADHL